MRARHAARRRLGTDGNAQRFYGDLIKDYGHKCFYCGTTRKTLHVDHYIPLIKGGIDALTNVRLACQKCNQEKHAKTPDEYRRWLIDRNYQPRF